MSLIQQQDLFSVLHRFGEACVYRPRSGSARAIVGITKRDSDFREVSGQLKNVRMLRLTVLKDESNEPYGGVAEPDMYDTVTLQNVTYTFSGRIIDENAYGWELEFQSSNTRRIGSNVEAQ